MFLFGFSCWNLNKTWFLFSFLWFSCWNHWNLTKKTHPVSWELDPFTGLQRLIGQSLAAAGCLLGPELRNSAELWRVGVFLSKIMSSFMLFVFFFEGFCVFYNSMFFFFFLRSLDVFFFLWNFRNMFYCCFLSSVFVLKIFGCFVPWGFI